MNRFETYFDAFYVNFTTEQTNFNKIRAIWKLRFCKHVN